MASCSFGGGTNVGRKRLSNEDSYKADLSIGLWLIADGMGGAKGGKVASETAINEIYNNVSKGVSLTDAIVEAHHTIVEASKNHTEVYGMGSTIVAFRCDGSADYEVAWVGDSRAYLWDKKLTRLTRDHSYVQQLIDEGKLSAKQAWGHPKSNVITQALGMTNKTIGVDHLHGRWANGQKILLCSDGLHGELRDTEIASLINQDLTDQEIANQLINMALEKGGRDNISVFLISSPLSGQVMEASHDATIPFFSETERTKTAEASQSLPGRKHWWQLSKPRLFLLIISALILLVALLIILPPYFTSP